MTWTTGEIEGIIMKRPRLAVALLQILVQRTSDFTHRIESFSADNVARRLARSLIRFSERLGTSADDGSVRMEPFTHELLSQYVGTSREVVTLYMNQFRRQGYLRYSRKGMARRCHRHQLLAMHSQVSDRTLSREATSHPRSQISRCCRLYSAPCTDHEPSKGTTDYRCFPLFLPLPFSRRATTG